MTDLQTLQDETDSTPEPQKKRRKYPWAMMIVAVLFVIIPFLSWYGTWFGRPLSDEQMSSYLNDDEKPRNVQHALSQIATRIIENDQSVKRWYPEILEAARHSVPQVRLTAAWVMGQDNSSEEFHSALLTLLKDSHPGVRHNAALSLVRFNDRTGRPELQAMLTPYTLSAKSGGEVEFFVEEGAPVGEGSPIVRIKQTDGQSVEIHAQEDGRVETLKVSAGTTVSAGDELIALSPSTEQVWQTLRAFFLIGQPEDIPFIQRYARPLPGMPDRIQKQAVSTLEAIRARASNGK